MNRAPTEVLISVRDLVVGFDQQIVLDHLALDVRRGEILGVVGASGSGKSVLLRTVIGLLPKRQGTITIAGSDPADGAAEHNGSSMARRWGILFQQGALFSSLTVRQNIQFPMRESLGVSHELLDELATAKLEIVGLDARDGDKYPAEISGGMTKRVALARALALDPDLVFLDEPTSGLDPISTREIDEMFIRLTRRIGAAAVVVTHDISSFSRIAHRAVMLGGERDGELQGRVIMQGSPEDFKASRHKVVRRFFGLGDLETSEKGNERR